jgi:hypothetical protein
VLWKATGAIAMLESALLVAYSRYALRHILWKRSENRTARREVLARFRLFIDCSVLSLVYNEADMLLTAGHLLQPLNRIYLRYHTIEQVLVGVGLGSAFAVAWFAIGHYLLRYAHVVCLAVKSALVLMHSSACLSCFFSIHSDTLKAIVALPISKWFLLKDSTDIDNVFVVEYEFYTRHEKYAALIVLTCIMVHMLYCL